MKLTRYTIFLVVLLLIFAHYEKLNAHNESELGLIPLTVKMDDTADELTKSIYPSLESKLLSILSNEGFSSLGKEGFYCVPSIIIESSDKAEGGMKTIFTVNGLLNIKITDKDGEIVLDNVALPIKGYATSQQKAVSSSVSSLDFAEFKTHLPQIKEKIKKYFKENKINIMSNAKKLAANGQYEEAIASLMIFPESVEPEYQEVMELAVEIYSKIPSMKEEEDSFSHPATLHNPETNNEKRDEGKPANRSSHKNRPNHGRTTTKTKGFNPSVLKKVAFNFINSQNNTKSR